MQCFAGGGAAPPRSGGVCGGFAAAQVARPQGEQTCAAGRTKKRPPRKEADAEFLCSYNLVSSVKIELLYRLLSHLVLENLTCGIHRELGYEVYISWHLVLCHV